MKVLRTSALDAAPRPVEHCQQNRCLDAQKGLVRLQQQETFNL